MQHVIRIDRDLGSSTLERDKTLARSLWYFSDLPYKFYLALKGAVSALRKLSGAC